MTATNDFLPFATAGGANVLSQSSYATLAALGTGFASGTAVSAQLNKVWRQASFIAACMGQFAANNSGNNSNDDGNVSEFVTNFSLAIKAVSLTALPTNAAGFLNNNGSGTLSWAQVSGDFLNAGTFTGTANALTGTCIPTAKTSLDLNTIVVGTLASTNTSTTVTLAADSSGIINVKLGDGLTLPPVSSLLSGHTLLFLFDGTNWRVVLDLTTGVPVGGTAYLPLVGGTLTGALNIAIASGDSVLRINKAASGNSAYIAGEKGGLNRWLLNLGNSTTEAGANAGSDFELQSFDDSGALIGDVLSIARATRILDFKVNPTLNSVPLVSAGTLVSQQLITTTSTYTPSANVKEFLVEIVGGGGSGGGGEANTAGAAAAGGGGSGGYARQLFTVASGTGACTIGTGGAPVTHTNNGNSGGTTTFVYNGITLSALGGLGGTTANTSGEGGLGGGATGGFLNLEGNPGGGGTSAGFPMQSGDGGTSPLGTAGRGGYINAGVIATAGINGGGGGGANGGSGAYDNSGAGGNGAILITEFK